MEKRAILILLACALAPFLSAHKVAAQDIRFPRVATSYVLPGPTLAPNGGVTGQFKANLMLEPGYIDMGNGNLHLSFPLTTLQQRGNLSLNEHLEYDSLYDTVPPPTNIANYYLGLNGPFEPTNIPTSVGGWRFVSGAEIGTLAAYIYSQTSQLCGSSFDARGNEIDQYDTQTSTDYRWFDPDNVRHIFKASWITDDNECSPGGVQQTVTGYAPDASGYRITLTGPNNGPPTSVVILDRDGTQVYPSKIDRYGNEWSVDGNGNLVDDVGRTPILVTTNNSVTYYDVLSPNGPINNQGTRIRYTVTNEAININEYSEPDIENNVPVQVNVVQSIGLPDGSAYKFTYDTLDQPGSNNETSGQLASVMLPTGGVIQYTWTDCLCQQYFSQTPIGYIPESTYDYGGVGSVSVASRKVESNAPTIFTYTNDNAMYNDNGTGTVGTGCDGFNPVGCFFVTVTEPSGDTIDYVYDPIVGGGNTTYVVFDKGRINSLSGDLELTENSYFSGSTQTPYVNSGIGLYWGSLIAVETTDYAADNTQHTTGIIYAADGSGSVSTSEEWLGPTAGLYGVGTNPPYRKTTYSYLLGQGPNGDYHPVADPFQGTTVDSNGNTIAQTTYTYTGVAISTSGLAQHGSANAGGPYLHTVSRWLANKSPIITSQDLDDSGMLRDMTDANGNPPTVMTYQCANSLPYTTTDSLGNVTTYSYDCSSGAMTGLQTPNDAAAGRAGAVYAYEPIAGRKYTIASADGGLETYAYPSSVEVDTTRLQSANPLVSVTVQDISDIFGRPYQHIEAGATSEVYYDANGRRLHLTNPHIPGTTSSTDGDTWFNSYDALDRLLLETLPGGAQRSSAYNGSTSTVCDESNNCTGYLRDVIGELTQVTEPDSSVTNYGYDVLGNLTSVVQAGKAGDTSRIRSFGYDSLSRLLWAQNPETGVVCYGHGNGTVPGCASDGYDPNGNLLYKTDARGVLTSFTYDSLNRLKSRSYSNDTANTPSVCYLYGTSTQGPDFIGRLYESWTQYGSCPQQLPSTGAISSRIITSYDPLGRVRGEKQCVPGVCTTTAPAAYSFTYAYDLAGHTTQTSDGIGQAVWTHSYDGYGRYAGTSAMTLWPTAFFPSRLLSVQGYDPLGGITAWTLGIPSSGPAALSITEFHDSRGRSTSKTVVGHD